MLLMLKKAPSRTLCQRTFLPVPTFLMIRKICTICQGKVFVSQSFSDPRKFVVILHKIDTLNKTQSQEKPGIKNLLKNLHDMEFGMLL